MTCAAIAMASSVALLGTANAAGLVAVYDAGASEVRITRAGHDVPIVTQHVRPDFRPYLHPIMAPDGNGVLTQFSPDHHRHQTGLYWGFTRVNGRDYFHHPGPTHWRRITVKVLRNHGHSQREPVQWQTDYELLDERGQGVLIETQIWSMREQNGEYVLDLQWSGEAKTNVTIGKYDYGGLFMRMPWRDGIKAAVVNSARQRNLSAEGQRATWLDVGMQVAGRDDLAHVTFFDHPQNRGFPQAWRVDGQFGVGPVPTRAGDWQLGKGETVELRYRLHVHTGPLDDVYLNRAWTHFAGQQHSGAMWNLARAEAHKAKLLTPREAAAAMTAPDGFEVSVWAAEPMITQPMAFCWDDRGRLWIAENRDYENRHDGFANSGDSRILILEDTDRDGSADNRRVFLEGIPFPAAIAVGLEGLWLGAPPNLLFIPDRNGDDLADTDDIEVRLTGWGIDDRHETINSLHWGPDGWLYGCQGFATNSRIGKPAGDGAVYQVHDDFPQQIELQGPGEQINGGVWRYHPVKDRFEVVAHGFSNPWGIDYNAKGQLFITACVIPHLWHVIPGGIYHRQGGQHFNPYFYSDLRTIADHRHRSAHGGARIYLSDAFPQRYHGQIFMANIHEHAVLTDVLQRRGSGYVGRHGEDFVQANNAHWVGFGVEIGPDGAIYVLDWHDADICGSDVVHRDTGRVFRIAPTETRAKDWPNRYGDLQMLTDAQLVELQNSPSAWHARRARVILQGRATQRKLADTTHAALWRLFQSHDNEDIRLRALWSLHITGGLSQRDLVQTLDDPAEHVRAWAIQLLCEGEPPAAPVLARFVEMARDDPSPVVRLYLAASLQRLTHDARWPLAAELVTRGEDCDDHNIPKMIWFGIEPAVPDNANKALQLALGSRIPIVAQYVARRLADDGQLEAVVQAVRDNLAMRGPLLHGLREALSGRVDVAAPPSWTGTYEQLKQSGDAEAQVAQNIARQFRDIDAAAELLAMLQDTQVDFEARRGALDQLAQRKDPQLRSQLPSLLDDAQMRRSAIQSIASFDDLALAQVLLSRYNELSEPEKLDAIHTLAARHDSGRLLTSAIERGDIPRADIPAYAARLLRRVVGPKFADVWGPLDQLSADHESHLARFRGLLTPTAIAGGNLEHGREIFRRNCLACHKMHGAGGLIGPDITGANRTNLDYLLGNIVTPSAVVQDAYRMHIVLTDDGRIYHGIPSGETQHQLKLRVASRDEPVMIPKSTIESREIANVSMMPEGLLKELSDADVVDLFAYLMRSR